MSVFDYTPKPWQRMRRIKFDAEELERQDKLVAARDEQDRVRDSEIWVNDEYQATVGYLGPMGKAGVCHLSIKRRDGGPAHDWRDLQSIKNEIMGTEREGVEIFPAESRLHDTADQTHIWVMSVGTKVEIGFQERKVMTRAEVAKSVSEIDPVAATKGSQRDWRPGLSTGPGVELVP
jgi:hypothetical protein